MTVGASFSMPHTPRCALCVGRCMQLNKREAFSKSRSAGLARQRSLRDQQIEERASEVLRSLPHAVVSSPEASSEGSDKQQEEGFLDLTEQHALSDAIGGVVSAGELTCSPTAIGQY